MLPFLANKDEMSLYRRRAISSRENLIKEAQVKVRRTWKPKIMKQVPTQNRRMIQVKYRMYREYISFRIACREDTGPWPSVREYIMKFTYLYLLIVSH